MSQPTQFDDWELLTQFSQSYRSYFDSFMDQIALHRAQAYALCRLFPNEGISQSELAELLGVQGATTTNTLKRMEEAGLISRQRDNLDNRLVRVYLTDEGRASEQAIKAQFIAMEESLFAGFSADDREQLRGLMGRLMENMSNLGDR